MFRSSVVGVAIKAASWSPSDFDLAGKRKIFHLCRYNFKLILENSLPANEKAVVAQRSGSLWHMTAAESFVASFTCVCYPRVKHGQAVSLSQSGPVSTSSPSGSCTAFSCFVS